MDVPDKYIYLIALIPFLIIWVFLFIKRRDLRKEILLISSLVAVLSFITSYLWWTKDWWRPQTITGTIVGIEDFLLGFFTGGIMSVIYDFIFKKNYNSNTAIKHHKLNGSIFLLFTFALIAWLFYTFNLTSFWSCTIGLIITILFMIIVRRDLFFNSFISGVSMMLISILAYLIIISLSSTWINNTYLDGLSGIRIYSVPIEEFIFWFLAGMWIGPYYEYCTGKKLKNI